MRRAMRGRPMGRRGPGLVGSMARTAVVAGTATATVRAVSGAGAARQETASKAQAYDQMLQDQQLQDAAAATVAQQQTAGAPVVAPDPVAEIARFAQLKDQGLLTDDEFTAKKAQILGI